MKYAVSSLYDLTQPTVRTALHRGSFLALFHMGWAVALAAFIFGTIAIQHVWSDFNTTMQVRQKRLQVLSSQTQNLITDMQKTIAVSRQQTEKLQSLSRNVLVYQGEHELSPSSSEPNRVFVSSKAQFQLYVLDPETGKATIDYSQIKN